MTKVNLDSQQKLIEYLADMGFDLAYYGYYDAHVDRERKPMSFVKRELLTETLAETALDFKYDSKERFFGHRQRQVNMEFGLNIAFRHSAAEFILWIKVDAHEEILGDPYQVLAQSVAEWRNPGVEHDPPYPTLPFSNRQELVEVVGFGVTWFNQLKLYILARESFQ
ncbi:MAG: hypothetical protein OEW08_11810 [Gammaproteobacteria bacterium]|nr:hypothetical protein [Gammaproteobacteria bacterium]